MRKLAGDGIEFTDHDLLIRVDTKVDGLTSEMHDLKTDLIGRVSKTEQRLDSVDIYHAQYPLKDLWETKTWADNFKANIKFMIVASGLLFGILGGFMTRMLEKWFKF